MFARLAPLAVALAAGLAGASCYDVRRPECGFFCGVGGECPDGYACSNRDNRCHLDGTSPYLVCPMPDEISDRPPLVVFTFPRTDANDVPLTSEIMVVFSKPVAEVTPETFLVRRMGAPILGDIAFTHGDSVATFRPRQPYELDVRYQVTLLDAIHDLGGIPLRPHSWGFTTVRDTTPPTVTAISPADGETGVSVTPQLHVTFSEVALMVDFLSFTLERDGVLIPSSINNGLDLKTATLTPQQLAPNTTYTARLSSAITDVAHNPMLPFAWSFTTAPDTTGPHVVFTVPSEDAVGVVSRPIRVRFSEAILGVSAASFTLSEGTGTVTLEDQLTAVFTPTSLPPETTITATLGAGITDLGLNPLEGAPYTWSFTTGADTTRPSVVLSSPADGATGVPTDARIVVTFSEPVSAVNTSSFVVRNGALTVSGARTSAAGGTEWTFAPTEDLPAGTTLSVELTTAIRDVPSNPAFPHTFSFTTAP